MSSRETYLCYCLSFFFFFNDTATTEIYTLSLHDALPISPPPFFLLDSAHSMRFGVMRADSARVRRIDRKSTRLNSSHLVISYAVFCLKKNHSQLRLARSSGVPGTPERPYALRFPR